jgi:hypothetical protein
MKDINTLAGYAKVNVKTLDGEKVYKFKLLKARENMRVYFGTIKNLMQSFAVLASDYKGFNVASIGTAIKGLEYDVFIDLAKTLLRGTIIMPNPDVDKFETIDNLEECEYYIDKPEEMYVAVFEALKANYPKSFSRLAKKVEDFIRETGKKEETLETA